MGTIPHQRTVLKSHGMLAKTIRERHRHLHQWNTAQASILRWLVVFQLNRERNKHSNKALDCGNSVRGAGRGESKVLRHEAAHLPPQGVHHGHEAVLKVLHGVHLAELCQDGVLQGEGILWAVILRVIPPHGRQTSSPLLLPRKHLPSSICGPTQPHRDHLNHLTHYR